MAAVARARSSLQGNFLRACLAAIALLVLPAAHAVERYDEAAFTKAQEEGRPILVAFHAKWCPTCLKQKPILERLEDDSQFAGLVYLVVNFDKPGQTRKKFNVTEPATLIMFKGATEVARSTSETNAGRIRAMVAKAFPAGRE